MSSGFPPCPHIQEYTLSHTLMNVIMVFHTCMYMMCFDHIYPPIILSYGPVSSHGSPPSLKAVPLPFLSCRCFFKSRFLTSENMQFLSLWVRLCLQSCDPSQARAHLRLTVSASVIISNSIHFPAGGRTLSFSMAEQNPFVTCPLSFPGPPKNMYLSSHKMS